jgi:hypothetical protein
MKKIIVLTLMTSVVSVGIFLSGCRSDKDVVAEKRADSLFLGISLGMTDSAFFAHCWKLNKDSILTHGPTNQNVEYRLYDALEDSVTMRFYPSFYDHKIYEMPVTFTYDKWAPWNKRYWADTLLVEMLGVFKKWYGNEFREVDHPTMGKIYVRFDGARRINLFKKDDQFVQAVFTDMRTMKKLKEQLEKDKKAEQ